MIVGGDPIATPSNISNTVGAALALAVRFFKITQKSGEVIISFLRVPGSLMHRFNPWSTSDADLSSWFFLKLEIV